MNGEITETNEMKKFREILKELRTLNCFFKPTLAMKPAPTFTVYYAFRMFSFKNHVTLLHKLFYYYRTAIVLLLYKLTCCTITQF